MNKINLNSPHSPDRLRFRQIHLDFHTSEQIVAVGEKFDPAEFAQTLKEAHVNSINLFAWCHHGMSYFDTRFPNKHPGLKIDLLSQQIDACHALDIKAPIYVTAGWDEYTVRTHPEWMERTVEGKPFGAGPLEAGWKKICLNSPFVDYFEERLTEVLEKFAGRIDGIWIDIISQDPCCCPWCMAAMIEKGLDPKKEADRMAQANDVMVTFKRRISQFIRRFETNCMIFFNSGHIGPYIRSSFDTYTHLELESLPSCREIWGYEHFPITVRYAKTLGLEYIGMTGKFHKMWGDFGGFKNQPALEYECFVAIAHGAKCCIGDQLHPRGKLSPATYELIGNVYDQIERKEPWCGNVEAVCEIALFTPEPAVGSVHHALNPSIRGAYRMLEESHYQFDIVDRQSDFGRYKVLILPDKITLDSSLKEKVETFIDQGGKLLLSHQSGMDEEKQRFVLDGLGIECGVESEFVPEFVWARPSLSKDLLNTEYTLYDRGMWVKPKSGAEVLADLWKPYFNRTYRHFCSHFHAPAEKESGYPEIVQNGNIIYFAHPIFAMYHEHGVRAYKLLVLNCLERLLPEKLVRTNAPATARINLNYQTSHDRYVAHVMHYIPEAKSKEMDLIEDVIPLHDVEFGVRLDENIRKVYLAPTMQELPFERQGDYVNVRIPVVNGHEMVVFEK